MTYRRCICHPDDLSGVGISSGWVTANSLCHPDDILFHFMSSGWLNWGWFLIRMSYGNVIMSSGWDTRPFLSHPDEIANFDFPQHAVALQRFRTGHTLHALHAGHTLHAMHAPIVSHCTVSVLSKRDALKSLMSRTHNAWQAMHPCHALHALHTLHACHTVSEEQLTMCIIICAVKDNIYLSV